MTEEKKHDSDMQEQKKQPELMAVTSPVQEGAEEKQPFHVTGSDAAPVPKKRVVSRKKKQPEEGNQIEAVAPVVAEPGAESEQAPVVKRTRRAAAKKTPPHENVAAEEASSLQQSESEVKPNVTDVAQDGLGGSRQETGAEGLQDAPKPPRRRATRKRAGAKQSDGENQQEAATTEDSSDQDKHEKKMPRGKKGAAGGKSSQSDNKVTELSFPESVARFVQHYHHVVTYLDDLSFRDALAKLHGQQSHWKPQLEEAISVFLDEALYVEEGMSLSRLRRTVATASDLWGAAHAAVVHTQGQFMRAAQVVTRLMQSLGEIMQLDFVVPAVLTEAFNAAKSSPTSVMEQSVAVSEDVPQSEQEQAADAMPSNRSQKKEGKDHTLLSVLQPFSDSSASSVLEDTQKRFADMASRVRQYSQSGVAQNTSYGYLVGAFYAELTVMQLALLASFERLQQQEKAGNHRHAVYEAWALLSQFKSELLPQIRASGVFLAEGDRRRGRGHATMPASESLTALLAAMSQSVSKSSAEPNHNSQQPVGQGYFRPPDLD